METVKDPASEPVCHFIVFVPYLQLPGGNQQICGAEAHTHLVDGREVDLCDVHLVEAEQAFVSASESLSFDEGQDGRRLLVIHSAEESAGTPPPE